MKEIRVEKYIDFETIAKNAPNVFQQIECIQFYLTGEHFRLFDLSSFNNYKTVILSHYCHIFKFPSCIERLSVIHSSQTETVDLSNYTSLKVIQYHFRFSQFISEKSFVFVKLPLHLELFETNTSLVVIENLYEVYIEKYLINGCLQRYME